MIATNTGGIPEIIKNNSNGFLIKKGDVNQFVSKINKLYNDNLLRKKMRVNSKKILSKKFNNSLISKKIDNVYNHILS